MIGLDTIVLVRSVAQDDARQSLKATVLIESLTSDSPVYVNLVAVVELMWMLSGCYAASRYDIAAVA